MYILVVVSLDFEFFFIFLILRIFVFDSSIHVHACRKDSFVTHRAMCEAALAADRETAQMPPPGAGLYVDSGSDSQGLGLSGAAAHMHGFADQGQSSSAAEASLFDHVMASYSGSSSMFRSQAPSDFSLSFFLGGGAPDR